MAIRYSLSKKGANGDGLYYANTRSAGVVDLKELCKPITQRCRLKEPMLLASAMAFAEAMEEELAEGRIVELGNVGRFQVLCSSTGAETTDCFYACKHMKPAKIQFRPGKGLKQMLKGVEYRRVALK